jgi:RNA polymerase sigma-70 factor (ECF subfamily)
MGTGSSSVSSAAELAHLSCLIKVEIPSSTIVGPNRGMRVIDSLLDFEIVTPRLTLAENVQTFSENEEAGKAIESPEIAGEADAWKQGQDLYDQLRPGLLARLQSLGLTLENAEDVIHETFVRLVEHLRGCDSNGNLRGWIYRVAYNLSMDVHRSERRYPRLSSDLMESLESGFREPVDPAPGPEEKVIRDEGSRRLKTAVLTLTFQQRNCLLLRAEGLRYVEIASTLGISVQRAAKLLKRGTTLLAACL